MEMWNVIDPSFEQNGIVDPWRDYRYPDSEEETCDERDAEETKEEEEPSMLALLSAVNSVFSD